VRVNWKSTPTQLAGTNPIHTDSGGGVHSQPFAHVANMGSGKHPKYFRPVISGQVITGAKSRVRQPRRCQVRCVPMLQYKPFRLAQEKFFPLRCVIATANTISF
jgi:hypothetical protein